MNRTITLACSLLFLTLLFTRCKKDISEDPNNIIIDIPVDFEIDLKEILSSEGKKLSFEVQTIKEKYCVNSEITYELNADDQSILLSLNEINPTQCEGLHPAKATIVIDDLDVSDYNFEIDLKKEIVNTGVLKVGTLDYTIEMDELTGIQFKYEELNRIPENTIWGMVEYEKSEFTHIAEDLIKDIELISSQSFTKSGYYGHFEIEDGEVKFDSEMNDTKVKTFIFSYKDNHGELENILNDFRENYGDDLTIRVFNDQGNEF